MPLRLQVHDFTLAHKSCVGQAVSLLPGNFKGFFDSIM